MRIVICPVCKDLSGSCACDDGVVESDLPQFERIVRSPKMDRVVDPTRSTAQRIKSRRIREQRKMKHNAL